MSARRCSQRRFARRDNIASGAFSSATLLRLQAIRKPGCHRRISNLSSMARLARIVFPVRAAGAMPS
jgi:hypothetical protein